MLKENQKPQDFCIAVASHPTGKIDVQGELEMVKSCILYADRIRLYSPTASLVLQVGSAIEKMSHEEALELVVEVMKHTGASAEDVQRAALLGSAVLEPSPKGWTKRAVQRRAIVKGLDRAVTRMAQVAIGWSTTPAFMELKLAEKAGILSFSREPNMENPMEQVADFVIAASGGSPRPGALERSTSGKEKVLAELIRAVMSESEYPLLDRDVQRLVHGNTELTMRDNPSVKRRSKAAGLGEDIFRRLPVPGASMDELLDLRKELSGVVSRFRRGLLKASSEIEGAQWDDSFQSEASLVYERYVAPALEELDDILKGTPALSKFFSVVASTGRSLGAVGGLYLIADKLLNLRPELGVALGLPVAAATFVFDQIVTLQAQRQQKSRDNDWFLVYEARRSLEEM
jgi:hypothetical protein